MSPSEEILNSIEDRLRQLAQEIAALQSARSELQGEKPAKPNVARRPRAPRTAKRAEATTPHVSEEEWVERRAAELAAQSRRPAAA